MLYWKIKLHKYAIHLNISEYLFPELDYKLGFVYIIL